MMKSFVEIWNKYLIALPSHLTTFAKIAIPIGALSIVIYSFRIGYFPRDLSISDAILFMVGAFGFGSIAVIFVGSLLSLGIFISPGIRLVFRCVIYAINKFSETEVKPHHTFAPFHWLSACGSLYAFILIFFFGRENKYIYWQLPLVSILLYIFYSIYRSYGEKIQAHETKKTNVIFTSDSHDDNSKADTDKLKREKVFTLLGILLIPFLFGGASGQLLDQSMVILHIRINHAAILVQEPYASLLSNNQRYKYSNDPNNWYRYNGASVLFTGYGKYSVVSVKSGQENIKLEIPNDKIIIKDYSVQDLYQPKLQTVQ